MKSVILTSLIASLIAMPSLSGDSMGLIRRQDISGESKASPEVSDSDNRSQIAMIPEAGKDLAKSGQGQVGITSIPQSSSLAQVQQIAGQIASGKIPALVVKMYLASNKDQIPEALYKQITEAEASGKLKQLAGEIANGQVPEALKIAIEAQT
ncbi:hypothetical protein CONCODRAFT_72247, partial [Conidiobolus coronatus NRRL 28638]